MHRFTVQVMSNSANAPSRQCLIPHPTDQTASGKSYLHGIVSAAACRMLYSVGAMIPRRKPARQRGFLGAKLGYTYITRRPSPLDSNDRSGIIVRTAASWSGENTVYKDCHSSAQTRTYRRLHHTGHSHGTFHLSAIILIAKHKIETDGDDNKVHCSRRCITTATATPSNYHFRELQMSSTSLHTPCRGALWWNRLPMGADAKTKRSRDKSTVG